MKSESPHDGDFSAVSYVSSKSKVTLEVKPGNKKLGR